MYKRNISMLASFRIFYCIWYDDKCEYIYTITIINNHSIKNSLIKLNYLLIAKNPMLVNEVMQAIRQSEAIRGQRYGLCEKYSFP